MSFASTLQNLPFLHSHCTRSHGSCRIYCISAGSTPSFSSSSSLPLSQNSEARELVRFLMRNFSDKEPLVKTLSKHVRSIRTEHCFLLFEEFGKTDKWLQCLEVFRWMQKQRWYVADNGIYSKLISVMGKRGQTRMAMWLFSEMRSSGCRPDTSVYNSLIAAHLHSKDTAKALLKAMVYFEKMKGIDRCLPNIVTYNILLRAFAQARDVSQVNALFADLEGRSIRPDITTFNGVMDAYGKNGMIKEMEAVLTIMKSNGCKPDTITFNVLIDSYGKKQEFPKMELVFKSLLKSKEKPTLPTFNSMIVNYGKARQRESAQRVVKKMTDMGYIPSLVTHESVIMMYGFCGSAYEAKDVFEKMIEAGVEPKVSTLNIMLDAYCRNSLHPEAFAFLGNARRLGVLPNSATYKLLHKAYSKAGAHELLQKLKYQMDRDGIVLNERLFSRKLGGRDDPMTERKSEKEKKLRRYDS